MTPQNDQDTMQRYREMLEAPVAQDSDIAAVIKLMNEDKPDGEGLRKIDFLSRFTEQQVISMTIHDATVALHCLPTDLLTVTSVFGRKLVSKEGKGREESVQMVSASMMARRMGLMGRLFGNNQNQGQPL